MGVKIASDFMVLSCSWHHFHTFSNCSRFDDLRSDSILRQQQIRKDQCNEVEVVTLGSLSNYDDYGYENAS